MAKANAVTRKKKKANAAKANAVTRKKKKANAVKVNAVTRKKKKASVVPSQHLLKLPSPLTKHLV